MIYLLSDIHGRKDKYYRLLEKINLQKEDKLFILGDVIDRGPDGISLLQEIMENPQITLMLGNHEYMMREALEHPKNLMDLRRWYNNGGKVTHDAYNALPEDEKEVILSFINELPVNMTITLNHHQYLLVHGAPMSMFSSDLYSYLDAVQFSVWHRLEMNTPVTEGETIIFGHTPTMHYTDGSVPLKIWHGKHLIDLDCGCAYPDYGGQLGCLCLDTMKEYYSDIDEETNATKGGAANEAAPCATS